MSKKKENIEEEKEQSSSRSGLTDEQIEAERAGKIAASKVFDYTYEEAVTQAEKELAEERKDD